MQIKKKTANMWEYKVGNDVTICQLRVFVKNSIRNVHSDNDSANHSAANSVLHFVQEFYKLPQRCRGFFLRKGD